MSILTSASSASVERGYEYYKSDFVHDVKQINEQEYEGYVKGSYNNVYNVKINCEHPKSSHCDCPHANGYTICKHMVALYFSIFPEEAEDYEEWFESDYTDEFDKDEEDYDDFRNDRDYDRFEHSSFKEPLFFHEVLDNYIDSLSIVEIKALLKKQLLMNKESTYYTYLEKNYQKYLNQSKSLFQSLNKLNLKINDALDIFDFDYHDFSKQIFTNEDIRKLHELYKTETMQAQIDQLLCNPKLAVYNNYQMIISFIKEYKTPSFIKEFVTQLENYLGSLKHYSIRNDTPKANILIAIHLLQHPSLKDLANSLLKNAKYIEYIEYVIKNDRDYHKLFHEFISLLNDNYHRNKSYTPGVLNIFIVVDDYKTDAFFYAYCLYGFLCKEDASFLSIFDSLPLKDRNLKEMFIKDVESKTKKIYVLSKLYAYYKEDDKLAKLLFHDNNINLMITYIEVLKTNYSQELYTYFIDLFYQTLHISKSRETYRQACIYLHAISQLNNGDHMVHSIIQQLKESDYKKCNALFDEIQKALNKK